MTKILAPVWNYLLGKGFSIKTSLTPAELVYNNFKDKISLADTEELNISLFELDDEYYNNLISQVSNKKLKKDPKISKIDNESAKIIAITLKNEDGKIKLIDGAEYINWLAERKKEKHPKKDALKPIKEKIYVIELTKLDKERK